MTPVYKPPLVSIVNVAGFAEELLMMPAPVVPFREPMVTLWPFKSRLPWLIRSAVGTAAVA